MPTLPARCTNPQCGAVFPSGILLSGSIFHLSLRDNTWPCPYCGSDGRCAEGEFNLINSVFQVISAPDNSVEMLREVGLLLIDSYKAGDSPEAIASKVEPLSPALASSLRAVINDPEHFAGLLKAAIMGVAAVVAAYVGGSVIEGPININFGEQAVYGSFNKSPETVIKEADEILRRGVNPHSPPNHHKSEADKGRGSREPTESGAEAKKARNVNDLATPPKVRNKHSGKAKQSEYAKTKKKRRIKQHQIPSSRHNSSMAKSKPR